MNGGDRVTSGDDDFKRATKRKRRWHSATGEDPRGRGRIWKRRGELVVYRTPGGGAGEEARRLQQTDSTQTNRPTPRATRIRAQCSAQPANTAATTPPQSRRGTLGTQDPVRGVPPQPSPTCTCAKTKQGKARKLSHLVVGKCSTVGGAVRTLCARELRGSCTGRAVRTGRQQANVAIDQTRTVLDLIAGILSKL